MQPEEAPDVAWVETLAGGPTAAAAEALEEAESQTRLFRHIAREHALEGRPFYGEIDAPLELHALVRILRPTHVVEVGVSSGVSSAYLLNALDLNDHGTLHSADLPRPARPKPKTNRSTGSWTLPTGRSPGWAVPQRLRARWDLRIGDKARILPLFAEELPSIDLFVYDVPHEDRASRREFRALDPRLPAGAVVIVDHGPGGGLCSALRGWARERGSTPRGRVGTGLYGMRIADG